MPERQPPPDDADALTWLLYRQHDVISRRQALRHLSRSALRNRLSSERWQRPHPGIYVVHTGPITPQQRRWIASLAGGGGRPAILGGICALQVLGLTGIRETAIDVLLPAGQREGNPPSGVRVHRSLRLPPSDVHLLASPPCTMPARSVIDAAAWARSDDAARLVIAAAFQQRMLALEEIEVVIRRFPTVRRRGLILRTVRDAAGGAHSLAELDFAEVIRRAGLPEPTRQLSRRDGSGRQRYLDVYWEDWKLHVEIDGSHHLAVDAAWADMRRQNDLWITGERVLRFPAWLIRERPAEVMDQVCAALHAAGWPGPAPANLGGSVPL